MRSRAAASAAFVFGDSELSLRAQKLDVTLRADGPAGLTRSEIRGGVLGSNNFFLTDVNAVLR